MISETLLKNIDVVAEELITSDPQNLIDLKRIDDCFQNLIADARNNGFKKITAAAEASSNLIKDVQLDKAIDREEVFELLKQAVSIMQQITRPGADISLIHFPEKLIFKMPKEAPGKKKLFTLPPYIDEDIFNDFLNDQDSVLEKFESHLLSLEKQKNKETTADLRRIFHTLKGESSVFELHDIERLCHHAEDLIDSSGDDLPIDSFFVLKDWFKSVFDALKARRETPEITDSLLTLFSSEVTLHEVPGHKDSEKDKEKKPFLLSATLDEEIFTAFLNDQDSVLEKMEANLLILENGTNKEILAELRRLYHTLKGEAGIFELYTIAKLCHASEDLIDSSPEVLPIDWLLSVKDWLKKVFDALKNKNPLPELDESLCSLIVQSPETKKDENIPLKVSKIFPSAIEKSMVEQKPSEVPGCEEHYIFSANIDLLSDFVSEIREHIDSLDNKLLLLESNPQDMETINAIFRLFHSIKGAAGFLALEDMAKLAHAIENFLDFARKGALSLTGEKIDIISGICS